MKESLARYKALIDRVYKVLSSLLHISLHDPVLWIWYKNKNSIWGNLI